jgi:hypothetical protein
MASFMIAHLNDGRFGDASILQPATARLMHAQAFAASPTIPGMALGFYHEDRNGHSIVGHAGDTNTFHSDLHLYLNDGVGLFVSFNSLGRDAAAVKARTLLFQEFTDRYFPAPRSQPPTPASAPHDAALVAGTYVSSRRNDDSFLRLAYLIEQTVITADKAGGLTVSDQKSAAGAVEHWREISPFVWRKDHDVQRLAVVMKDGRVSAVAVEGSPYEVLQPASGGYAPWNLMWLEVSLFVLLTVALLWPVTAIVRRRYARAFALSGRAATLYRLTRAVAVLDLVLALGWLALITALEKSAVLLTAAVDPWLRLLQLGGVLAVIGVLVGLANLVHVWRDRDRSWWAKVSSMAIVISMVGVAFFVIAQHLLGPSLEF